MRDVAEILEHWQAGRSIKAIQRSLGVDRGTIRKYVRAAQAQGYHPASGGGPPQGWRVWVVENFPGVTERWQRTPTSVELEGFREEILAGLRENRAATVWQRLRDEKGLKASDNSFRRYIKRHLPGVGKQGWITVRRQDPPPGEEAQIDFGYLGLWQDPSLGRGVRLWVFIMVLSLCRHMFACVVRRMNQIAWLECHRAAFQFWGGVPGRGVPDNLKSGVLKPDLYDPKLNKGYEGFARHYGFLIDPARAGKARDKARVERLIPYVRESFWKGRDFSDLDLEGMNQALEEWCLKVAGMRLHGTTRQRPLEVFLGMEKGALRPLPREPFELATWYRAKMGDDCHIYVASGGYSIPYQYRGKELDVRVTDTLVQCFLDHELVKTHRRVGKGQRSTDWNDYPPEKGAFFSLTPDRCRTRAAQLGEAVREVVEALLQDHLLHHLRQVHGILRLGDKYGPSRLNAACRRALNYSDPAYRTIKTILEKGLDRETAMAAPALVSAGAFLRGPEELFAPVTGRMEAVHD